MVLVVVLTCIGLGRWQLDRLRERRASNHLIEVRSGAAPVPLDAVAPQGKPLGPDALAYHRVEATGRYDAKHQVILFGRSLNGQTGNHVVTPLLLPDGRVLIVDRGWLPETVATPGNPQAAPLAGEVHVVGVLIRSEASGGRPPPGGLSTVDVIDVGELGEQAGATTIPTYLWLQTQQPPAPSGLPHLSYAIQWFSFAAIALIGYGAMIRKERRERASASTAGVPAGVDAQRP